MANRSEIQVPAGKRVTLAQVASAAGLARTTVSDILNRNAGGKYSECTRELVSQTVARLGYAPYRPAQQLARGKSGQVGLLLTRDFSNPFWARVANAVERALRARKYRLQLAVSENDPDAEAAHARQLRDDGVEGLIVGPVYEPKDAELHQAYLRGLLPLVIFGMRSDRFDSVVIDERASGDLATTHLQGLGHRRIGYIAAPDADLDAAEVSRFSAMRDRLRTAGTYEPRWIIRHPDQGRYEDFAAAADRFAAQWLAAPADQRPTAVLCHNDQCATAALACFHRRGLAVPGDLSVVAFDNLPEAAFLIPALTTIDNCVEQQMSAAVDLLVQRLDAGRGRARTVVIPPRLVVRDSTSPPAA